MQVSSQSPSVTVTTVAGPEVTVSEEGGLARITVLGDASQVVVTTQPATWLPQRSQNLAGMLEASASAPGLRELLSTAAREAREAEALLRQVISG